MIIIKRVYYDSLVSGSNKRRSALCVRLGAVEDAVHYDKRL